MFKIEKIRKREILNFLKNRKKISFIIIFVLLLLLFIWRNTSAQNSSVYQTASVERGSLVSSISASGSVLVANRTTISTQASGVISQVYVKNGDTVALGDKIAEVSLDQTGVQKQAATWSSYLTAKNNVDSTSADLYSLQSTMYSKWKTYNELAQNSTYQNPDGSPNTSNRTLPQFTTVQDDWLKAEADYKNQQGKIDQSYAAVNSSWLSYQLASSTIVAPLSGTVLDLTITPGMQIAQSTSATGGNSSQVIGSIKMSGNPVVNVNLSEMDAPKIKAGQKATLTFDALVGKTYTGKILGINTTGMVSSGVTTYPATIVLDLSSEDVLSNMSANANIIVDTKDNVLQIPSSAVLTSGDQSVVRVLRNGQLTQVPVETGISSDTQTEIVSGLSEGDQIVTVAANLERPANGSSPFSGGFRVGGGSGGMRTVGR